MVVTCPRGLLVVVVVVVVVVNLLLLTCLPSLLWQVGLQEGMVVSNEPGYYSADDGFGIRIENLLAIRKKETTQAFNGKAYLGFEQLTHVPIQAKMIEPALLTPAEVAWLDDYHGRVWDLISPRLEVDSEACLWLRRATLPLDEQFADEERRSAPGF